MGKIKRNKSKHELMIAVALVAAIFGVMWYVAPWRDKRVAPVVKAPEVVRVRRALDGVMVEKGKESPPIAGVMIENMVEAQPLSGVADASLVFEAVTEANITRFLAYFILDAGGPSFAIGPVRSARPYYLDWASEFDTLYAHVGSAPAAYELLRKKGVDGVHDLDQWYNSQYFTRVTNRFAPHNVYTNTELLAKAYEAVLTPTTPNPSSGRRGNEAVSSPFEGEVRRGLSPWQFKNDASPDLRGNVTDIAVGYTAPYNVKWKYDVQKNQYGRLQWAGMHKDANGKEIIAKNIAVAFEEMKVLDDMGRKEFTTIGEGKGLVFQDGRVVVGTWKKAASRERMRFYDGQGNEVAFNAGVTWIEIVPKGYEVKY